MKFAMNKGRRVFWWDLEAHGNPNNESFSKTDNQKEINETIQVRQRLLKLPRKP